jgi:guanine deaminase
MEERFGNFDLGKEADFLVVEPSRVPALAGALRFGVRSGDHERASSQVLFTLLMGLREPAIVEVFVRGRNVKGRNVKGANVALPPVNR